MGVDKYMVCEGCNEYVSLDKVPFPSYWITTDTENWFNYPNYRYQTMKMMSFVVEHQGHEIRYITEASKYESLFYDIWSDDDSTEFELDVRLCDVHKQMEDANE